jgi:hypothetical protein
MLGYRVTDAVEYYQQRGEERLAVRVVRRRDPDKFRWKGAVSSLSRAIASLRGSDRSRVEEPVREIVLDVEDAILQRECVLDARRFRVDLDRGEILTHRTMGDVRRTAFLAGVDLDLVRPHVELPEDFGAPVDVAGVVLVGRAYATQYRERSQRLLLALPTSESESVFTSRHHAIAEQAEADAADSKRWAAVAKALL